MDVVKKYFENDDLFIIAEIGVNYYDIAKKLSISLIDAAKLMIKEAHEAGADAVKFQTYKAEKLASKNSPAYWDTSEEPTLSQYELFTKFDSFGQNEYRELAEYCQKLGVVFLSTPFDFESADYLNELMPFYKVSSSDITNLPFIKHMAEKFKPMVLSTGASTIAEIDNAVNTILDTGNKNIVIMHCVLDYPTKYENANLNMLKHLKNVFPSYLLGYSDHTKPDSSMLVLTMAYEYGARVIEKHFTLDKTLKGNDHYHAMEPSDLRKFVDNIKLIKSIGGEYYKRPLDCEKSSRKQARRSIVAKQNISIGQAITIDMLTYKRPGTGISPAETDKIIGRKVTKNIKEDEIITWNNFN